MSYRKLTARGRSIVFSCFFVLGLAVTPALAQAAPTTIYECHNCSAGAMANVARSVVAKKYRTPQPGDGDYATVYNLGGNRIATYWVGWYQAAPRQGGDPPRYRWYVSAAETPPTAVVNAFSGLRNIYVKNGNSLILIFDGEPMSVSSAVARPASALLLSPSASGGDDGCWEVKGMPNAYDAAVSSAVRNDVRDYLTQQFEEESIYGEYVWDIFEVVKLAVGVASSYEVPFVSVYPFLDGGSIAYRYDSSAGRLQYIGKTIEDCENNTVPEDKEDFEGAQFRFRNEYNLNEFTGYVEKWGGHANFSGSGRSQTWICNSGIDSNGRVYVNCVLQ